MLRRSVWLFIMAGIFAVTAASPEILAAFEVDVPSAVAAAAGLAALATVGVGVWQARYEKAVALTEEQVTALREGCLTLPSGKLPKVRQWTDPLNWGVHRAAASYGNDTTDPTLPPYVPRDIDDQLRTRLSHSGFVLLVGDSTAGKTRCAFEAVTACLPSHRLIIPTRTGIAAALDAAARHSKCVLWLNDINSWIADPALTREAVTRLIAPYRNHHRVIVATLRATEDILLRSHPIDNETAQSHRKGRNLLERAHRFDLPRLFTPTELDRARAHAEDERIADALGHADTYGIAEYLANGPQLLAEWYSAWSANTNSRSPGHPRGAALIATAVDLSRSGWISPIPRALIETLHTHYLDQRGGDRLCPEPLSEAWAWATRPRQATTRLLHTHGGEHVSAFDYLTDAVQKHTSPETHVPEHVITTALNYATFDDAQSIGHTARTQDRRPLSIFAHRHACSVSLKEHGEEHPITFAQYEYYCLLLSEDRRNTEAEAELRRLLEISHRTFGTNSRETISIHSKLGLALKEEHPKESEEEYRKALQGSILLLGDMHETTLSIRSSLASTLEELGRKKEAEEEHRRVIEASTEALGWEHPTTLDAIYHFGMSLAQMGRLKESEANLEKVLEISKRKPEERPNMIPFYQDSLDLIRRIMRDSENRQNSK